MKHIFTIAIFVALSISLQAQQATKPAAAQPVLQLKTSADSTQYILGAYLGQYIRGNGFSITNAELFIKGMNDGIANNGLMVDAQTITTKITEYQSRLANERNVMLEKQLFESVKGKPGVGMLPSGVCYSIVKAGNGIRPLATDSVQLHVKGFLPDNRQFEDTYTKNAPYRVTPAGLMPGLNEIIQIMPVGSLWKVYVPSSLAFGAKGLQGLIPPYSALIYELELLAIKK